MQSQLEIQLKDKLKVIRETIDADVSGCDIDTVVEKGKKLAALIGLSAECKAAARKALDLKRLAALKQMESGGYQASVMLKLAESECALEWGLYEYIDRLNAGIAHQLDYYRTVISLYKSELENSLKT